MRDGDICLTVTDDGDGFDFETAKLDRGDGLLNIKDRADGWAASSISIALPAPELSWASKSWCLSP